MHSHLSPPCIWESGLRIEADREHISPTSPVLGLMVGVRSGGCGGGQVDQDGTVVGMVISGDAQPILPFDSQGTWDPIYSSLSSCSEAEASRPQPSQGNQKIV